LRLSRTFSFIEGQAVRTPSLRDSAKNLAFLLDADDSGG